MSKVPAYVTISWVFLILTGIVFCYSCFFYPDAHPIACVVKQYTGKDCPTCGFSRAFSSYTRLQFDSGKSHNPGSWPVFLFFVLQFVIRILVVAYNAFTGSAPSSNFIKADILISISTFLLAFLPLLF